MLKLQMFRPNIYTSKHISDDKNKDSKNAYLLNQSKTWRNNSSEPSQEITLGLRTQTCDREIKCTVKEWRMTQEPEELRDNQQLEGEAEWQIRNTTKKETKS